MPSHFTSLPKPIEVKPRSAYRLWLRYDDGVEGEVDLSDLAGRGVFIRWADPEFFRSVRLGIHGAIEWEAEIDLCPDALYMRLTGKSPEELLPALRSVHAAVRPGWPDAADRAADLAVHLGERGQSPAAAPH